MGNKAFVIYLNDGMLLSKKKYSYWKEIQDEYHEEYIASLNPMTCEELLIFFKDEFAKEENWPFSRKNIIDFFKNDDLIIRTTI